MLPQADLETAARWAVVGDRIGRLASHGTAHDPDGTQWYKAGYSDGRAVRDALSQPDGTPDGSLGVVVDWGCGAGRLEATLNAEHVFAADVCESVVRPLEDEHTNLSAVVTDIPLLAAPIGCADVVVSLHTLYSVTPAGVRETIRQLSELLKTGGHLVLDIPWWLEDDAYHKDPAPDDLPGGWWVHRGMEIMSGWGDQHLWLCKAPAPLCYTPGNSPRWSDLEPLSLWVWRKQW